MAISMAISPSPSGHPDGPAFGDVEGAGPATAGASPAAATGAPKASKGHLRFPPMDKSPKNGGEPINHL